VEFLNVLPRCPPSDERGVFLLWLPGAVLSASDQQGGVFLTEGAGNGGAVQGGRGGSVMQLDIRL
jgi:hypothetical protein